MAVFKLGANHSGPSKICGYLISLTELKSTANDLEFSTRRRIYMKLSDIWHVVNCLRTRASKYPFYSLGVWSGSRLFSLVEFRLRTYPPGWVGTQRPSNPTHGYLS